MVVPTRVVVGILVVTGVSTALLSAVGWRHREVVGADWFVAMMSLMGSIVAGRGNRAPRPVVG